MSEWNKKRQVIRRYDAAAHIYDLRYEEEQTAKYAAALESLEKRNLGLVLDAGCGTGLLFNHLKNRAKNTIGLDISRKPLLKAKERARSPISAHLIRADADYMPIRDSTFDYVFAVTLIQNSPDPARTLREIKRPAKEDAEIIITGLKKIFTKENFQNLLRNAGLQVKALNDETSLKCYVATCTKMLH
jgi:ubiquinone/menaquinone biosynthesis C-methylase UbiE